MGGPNFKGHKHSEETKMKMRNSNPNRFATNKGRKLDEQWRKNIGIASSKRFKGKKKSEQHKLNMSLGRLGISPGNKGKKRIIENGKIKYV